MIYPDLEMDFRNRSGACISWVSAAPAWSGIARMMHEAGVPVTGSDRSASYTTEALERLGVRVSIGHDAANVGDADTLVVTGALWQDNPSINTRSHTACPRCTARTRSRGSRVAVAFVAVAGAHGKTTSTGMLVTGLIGVGADPRS